MKRAIVCLVGLLIAPAAFGQATTLRFEVAPRLALPVPRVRDPHVALRAGQGLSVVAIQELEGRARVVALSSSDDGDSFSDPVSISLPGTWVYGSGESGLALATSAAGMCVAWHQARAGGGTDLMAASSTGGSVWSKPVRLADAAGIHHGYVALAAAGKTIYAAWLDARTKPAGGAMDVYLARSTDGGRTFGKNVRVGGRACNTCRPALAVTTDGAVHVAWRTVGEGVIAVAASRDEGATFGEARPIASGAAQAGECLRSGPALAAVGTELHAAWLAGEREGIFWAVSSDSGKSFMKPMGVTQGVLDASHPSLSISAGGRVHLAFEGRPDAGDGWLPRRAYVAEVTTWVSASRGGVAAPGVYDHVSYPACQFDASGRLWMFWTAGEAILLSRAREVSAS